MTASTRQLLITFIPSISLLVAVAAASVLSGVGFDIMTRDVTATAGVHPLTGVLSSLGILLWCAAASVCAFAAITLPGSQPPEAFRFLLSSALLSAYLLLDDFFLIHDELVPRYVGLGQEVVYATLGIALMAYLVVFRGVILRTNFSVLLLALGFLAASVVLDALLEPWLVRLGDWQYLIEDGAKWLGIAAWCSYYVRTSWQLLAGVPGLPHGVIQSGAKASLARVERKPD